MVQKKEMDGPKKEMDGSKQKMDGSNKEMDGSNSTRQLQRESNLHRAPGVRGEFEGVQGARHLGALAGVGRVKQTEAAPVWGNLRRFGA